MATAHHSHFNAVLWFHLHDFFLAAIALPISGKAFEITDSHGWLLHFQPNALALALLFLWAHTAANGRERTCLLQCGCSVGKVSAFNIFDEFWNVDTYGAARHALWIVAVEAASGFSHRLLLGDALIHLLIAGDAVCRVELGHFHTLDSSALFWRNAAAQFHAPFFIA